MGSKVSLKIMVVILYFVENCFHFLEVMFVFFFEDIRENIEFCNFPYLPVTSPIYK